MKTKQLVVAISAFVLTTFLIGNAYATYDSHVHTANGTIDTWPTITVTGTHKLRVCAPTVGVLSAFTTISGILQEQVDARNGSVATSSGHTLTASSNVLFTSWVDQYGSGTGKAYLADSGTTLPNCGAN